MDLSKYLSEDQKYFTLINTVFLVVITVIIFAAMIGFGNWYTELTDDDKARFLGVTGVQCCACGNNEFFMPGFTENTSLNPGFNDGQEFDYDYDARDKK